MSDHLNDAAQVRDYYDRRVPLLDRQYANVRWGSSPIRRQHYRQTLQALRLELAGRRLGRCVEVGSGPLIWTPLLRERARLVVAVDLSMAMLSGAAREVRDIPPRCCADAAQLPLADDAIDSLCTIRAFEYFPDKPAVVREFARALRPGGYLMIVTKNREYRGYSSRQLPDAEKRALHSANITARDLVRLMRDSGFDDVVIRPVIVGRTNVGAAWVLARWLMRLLRPHWSVGIPSWLSGAVESFMVTGRRVR